jgi:hypothetical protein
MIERNLYEMTGNVLDINTMLINHSQLHALVVGHEQLQRDFTYMKQQRDQLRAEVERLKSKVQDQALQIISLIGQEQEQAEPVAWMYDAATYPEGDLRGRQWKHNVFSVSKPYMDNNMVNNLRGLYTAPQGQTELLRQALEALSDERYVSDYTHIVELREAIKQHLGEA